MSRDLRRRLERLDRGRPRARSQARSRRGRAQRLPPGVELDTPEGLSFRIDTHYANDYRHGHGPLHDVLSYEPSLAAEVAGDANLKRSRVRRWGFMDIETTGLSGGAGTLGFLIGLGTFHEEGFNLRQYFVRDPEEEAATLLSLRSDLAGVEGIVTFNGRTFDLPVLESRYTIALRDRWRVSALPHLDLLYPSRRLWSKTLLNCRLNTLERHVLQVKRTEEDVSGELIPGMYLDYLRTGDATDILRVIYHNAIDILSLVGLASVVLNRHRLPDPTALSGAEALAVARWHAAAGRIPEAEATYQAAVAGAPNRALKAEALKHLTGLLKRQNRRPEAVPAWEEWHRSAPIDPSPCIELAMYYEWEARSLAEAMVWSETALKVMEGLPDGWKREQRTGEVEHRIRRLRRKLAG